MGSNDEVILKMKSRHVAVTITKKKKNIVLEVLKDMSPWPGRHLVEGGHDRCYFGLKTLNLNVKIKGSMIYGLKAYVGCSGLLQTETMGFDSMYQSRFCGFGLVITNLCKSLLFWYNNLFIVV